MTFPTTLSLSRAYARLGVRSRLQPEYRTSPMQPVIMVADISNTFAPEAIEARVVWATIHQNTGPPGPPASANNFQVQARGAGGLVIEHLEVLSSVAVLATYVAIVANDWGGFPAPIWTAIDNVNIGGDPVASVAQRGQDSLWPVGSTPRVVWNASHFIMPSDRTYIPAGAYLQVQATLAAVGAFDTEFLCVAREIPEMLGAP